MPSPEDELNLRDNQEKKGSFSTKRLNKSEPGKAHKFFRSITDEATGAEGAGQHLLRILGIPPDLSYLKEGLARTQAILNANHEEFDLCIDQGLPENRGITAEKLMTWIQAVLGVVGTNEIWNVLAPRWNMSMARPSTEDKHPLRGYCLNYLHHWCNLFYTTDSNVTGEDDYQEILSEFSIYLLAAFSKVSSERYESYIYEWEKNAKQPEKSPILEPTLSSRVGNASRAIRRFSLGEYQNGYSVLRECYESESSLSDALTVCLGDEEIPIDDFRMLDQLGFLIGSVHPVWRRPAGGAGGSHGGSQRGTLRRRLRDGYVRIADSDTVLMPFSTESRDSRVVIQNKAKTKAHSLDKNYPTFDQLDRAPWEMMGDDDDLVTTQAGKRALRSRRAADHVRKLDFAHQNLYPRLTGFELTAIKKLFAVSSGSLDEDSKIIITLLAIVAATGRSLNAARKLRIRKSTEPRPLTATIEYLTDLEVWVFPVPPLAYEEHEVAATERQISSEIVVPDLFGFRHLLAASGLQFRDGLSVKKIRGRRRKQVTSLLTNHCGSRITLQMVENYLFFALLESTNGDIALSNMLTGHVHTHAISTRHYSHYVQERVIETYHDAVRPIAPDLGGSKPFGIGIGFGARRVPTKSAVTELLVFLKKESRRTDCVATAHNAYNSYVQSGLILGTGYRPVTDPSVKGWSTELSMVTYRDKAPTDYHRRISVLPEPLAQQLLRHAIYVARMRAAWGGAELSADEINFYWLTENNVPPQPYRPSNFEEIALEFGMELYSLRKFMRTTLISTPGVQVEDVDVWMGHWFYRVSPFDELSTYPLARLTALANGPVREILESVGFTVVGAP